MPATKKPRTERPAAKKRVVSAPMSKSANPVALTVKVNHGDYVRLCTLGANERRTNQDILHEAITQYLDRVGA